MFILYFTKKANLNDNLKCILNGHLNFPTMQLTANISSVRTY